MHSKLLLKKLQVKNRSVWHSVECAVSKRRHREGRIENREEISLAQQERRFKETKLERRTSCQSYRDRKPRKCMNRIVI